MPGFWPGKTGTLRCSVCSINYPSLPKFRNCPVCGTTTDLHRSLKMDDDWLELAMSLVKVIDGEVPDTPP